MSNSIERRVAEFLSAFPPFTVMSKEELDAVAHSIHIRYCDEGERIFTEGEETLPTFFVVRKGSVRVFRENTEHSLVDLCDEGDLFGIRPLLANDPYLASAETAEETLLYEIPAHIGNQVLRQNPKVGLYLATGYAAGMPISRLRKTESNIDQKHSEEPDASSVSYTKNPTTCNVSTTIREAAQIMTRHHIGSIVVVNEHQLPIGIITDSDLRRKVVAVGYDDTATVEKIMSKPVVTTGTDTSHSRAIVLMLDSGIQHLCITEDSTKESELIGIVSLRDLMISRGLHPASIINGIKRANSITEVIAQRGKLDALLERYRKEGTDVAHVCEMNTIVSNHVIQKLYQLFAVQYPKLPAFAWLALGSMGRKEQILKTDQDHVIVAADDCTEEDLDTLQSMAQFIERGLSQWGIEVDEAGVHSSSNTGIRTLASWKSDFTRWIHSAAPDALLNVHIYFDYRCVVGDANLVRSLSTHIQSLIHPENRFLTFLASDALNTASPLGFFRQFIVEKNGAHEDEFDLKRRVMLPLCDAARVLVLSEGRLDTQSTSERFQLMSKLDPPNASIFKDAAAGYEWLLKLRWHEGTTYQNSGRFIDIESLSKFDRHHLRDIFSTLSEIQQILKVRFRTEFLGR